MLSRVAENLYWMARYIERAEDLTRLLAVNFNVLLDTQPADARQGWQPLVTITGDEALFTEIFGQAAARPVMEFLFWHPLNPNAVTACLTRARENARSVREQISTEMWEHLNRLYFFVRDIDRAAVLDSPTEFFRQVRDGSQAFQGIAAATLIHGEPYEFIQLGLHLERADKTARILDAKYVYVDRLLEGAAAGAAGAEAALQLIALLRSCSALDPYRRAAQGQLTTERVLEYLLLDREFPRAVLFCVNRCLRALDVLGGAGATGPKPDHPRRTLGRLSADLEYLDIREILGAQMDPFLNRLLTRLNAVGDDIARTYFNTRVILPDERPRQQQQQQQ